MALVLQPLVVSTTLLISVGLGATTRHCTDVPLLHEVTAVQLAVPDPTPGIPLVGGFAQLAFVLLHFISTLLTVPCNALVLDIKGAVLFRRVAVCFCKVLVLLNRSEVCSCSVPFCAVLLTVLV